MTYWKILNFTPFCLAEPRLSTW